MWKSSRLLLPSAAILALAACASREPLGFVAAPKPPRFLYSSERGGGVSDDPALVARDVTGRSVKTPRVRAVHTDEPGGTLWLIRNDPWLAWARGRELFLREFSAADGAFGEAGRLDGKTLDDGSTRIASRDHASSCAMCHNVPWRDGGAGATIPKNGGSGRNTPHVFGAGLLEMIGLETTERLRELGDRNGNGRIDLDEGGPAVLDGLDYGSFADGDGDGRPDLNEVLYVWYVDADNRRIPWARSLRASGVAGYLFETQIFGFGQRDRLSPGGVAATLRAFSAGAFDIHAGLTPCDGTLNDERISACGARQTWTGTTRDRAQRRDAAGRSLDDPDRDGVIEEITEGDLDLIEFYQLNHPRPAERPHAAGRAVFDRIGCARCHVPDRHVRRDRRFFDLEVDASGTSPRGRIVRLRGGPAVVRGVYSDFLHHDLGPAFHETQFDGSVIRKFRTTPLWGAGSTAPYGHDGASLDLDAVIRRHGGEAAAESDGYARLADADRAALLEFLRGLVLYATDTLDCDVDGDGRIADRFQVAGADTGPERFNPEWLFRVPGRIEGWRVNVRGERIFSRALTNLREAYGCDLPWLQDRDRNGWPDVLDR